MTIVNIVVNLKKPWTKPSVQNGDTVHFSLGDGVAAAIITPKTRSAWPFVGSTTINLDHQTQTFSDRTVSGSTQTYTLKVGTESVAPIGGQHYEGEIDVDDGEEAPEA